MIVRGARRAAFAPVSASSLPTKRKPPRAGCASLDECAFEDVLASSSASPVARISRRESAAPHPRATRVAARSSISAIFTPPRRIGRHGTAIHATASCVFLHAALTTRAIGSPGFGSPPRAGKPLVRPRSERSDARAFAPYTADLIRHLARAPRRLSRVRLRVCVPDASLCAKDALFLLELFPRWVSECADEMVHEGASLAFSNRANRPRADILSNLKMADDAAGATFWRDISLYFFARPRALPRGRRPRRATHTLHARARIHPRTVDTRASAFSFPGVSRTEQSRGRALFAN